MYNWQNCEIKNEIEDISSDQWTPAEFTCLLSLWGVESVQPKIKGLYQNKSVYEDISAMSAGVRGFKRLWLQCHSLTLVYKEAS